MTKPPADSLFEKTTEQIRLAVGADAQNKPCAALAHYNEALRLISSLLKGYEGEQRAALEVKFCEYASRVSELLALLSENAAYAGDLRCAHEALTHARQLCRSGRADAAIDSYIRGLGHYQSILSADESAGESVGTTWIRELRRFALVVLEEAENAKQLAADASTSAPETAALPPTGYPPETVQPRKPSPALPAAGPQKPHKHGDSTSHGRSADGLFHQVAQLSIKQTPTPPSAAGIKSGANGSSSSSNGSSNGSSNSNSNSNSRIEKLTPEEMEVVKRTSHVNGLTFLPWLDNDLGENFVLQDYYTDKDGLLMLSPKQQRKLSRWRRASQIYTGPRIFGEIGCGHIVQETVTDCSFVAALCVSVEYERRFNRQLITQNIYPQGPSGKPVFSPSGKYMVKLYVNGFWRRVVIDDLLPVAESGKLMCTYSTAGDIGQSLVEKAYLKVMGGYDFPGSNSSTDLHILTGWIPEHVFVQGQTFNADRTWKRMCDGSRHGDVLLTIATGEMSSDLAGMLGLVPSHAYAVLDVREVCGHRLLKVKNPWSSLRWTGTFSHADRESWTPELMRTLKYDPAVAEDNDRGIFWIDYESVCHRFDAIHLNWNPAVFAHRTGVHFEWELSMGPRQALYDFSANPQYTLKVEAPSGGVGGAGSDWGEDGAPASQLPLVWILLSKHVLKTEENRDFIALHVYDGKGGRRIYEPRSAMRIGEYVNIPHVLVQFSATPGESYTLVVAQKDKTKPLYFTLRAFCETPISVHKAPVPDFVEEIQGQWGSGSAGGNTASPRYLDNPQYRLTVKGGTHPRARFSGIVALESTQKHPVNLRVFRGGFLVTRVLEINSVANSGKYRTRYCTCMLDSIEEGSYTIVASTFEPFMFSRFKLTVGLDAHFTVAPIPREGAGMRLRELHGRWAPGTDSMGGPVNQFYSRNPRFLVRAAKTTSILVRLQTPQAEPLPLINVSVFALGADAALGPAVASSGSYTNSPQGVATRLAAIDGGDGAEYLVVASTWEADVSALFVLYFYSEDPVDVVPLCS